LNENTNQKYKGELMKIRYGVIAAAMLAVAGMAWAAENAAKAIMTAAPSKFVNPFVVDGKWYRANLHTHTTLSDGDVNLPVRVKQYRDKSYQVLAVTDHERTNNVSGYSDKDFLLISGMETHPKSGVEVPYHFVCLNIPEGLTFTADVNAAERIRRVKAAGGEIIFAHPYWSGHTINQLLAVEGYIGIEVFNGIFARTGKGYSSVQWDDLLNAGHIMPAMANDDLHDSNMIGQSWTMIKAKELTIDAIMNALRNGCYYATCGPVFEDFRVEQGFAKVKCSPVAEIHVFAENGWDFYDSVANNKSLTSAQYKLSQGIRYVRAEVVDANGKHAWTNAIEVEKHQVKD
jgi:predicted metal-dependent phosphoesterase TrpH